MAAFVTTVLLSQFITANLTDPPVSESGLLYKTVEFNCKGIGDGLVWTVANYPLNDTVKQKRNINVTTSNTSDILSSNLTIHALPINHGIEIGCIVHSLHPNYMAEAKEVKLTVKGVSPVVNVQWHSDSKLLAWLPPLFYFNGSSNHTEFVYNVLLNGIHMINTTNTSIYLNISNCASFNVSITVYTTDHYVSQENNQIYFNSGNYTIATVKHTVTFDQRTDAVNINLTNLVTFTDYVCDNTIYVKGIAINKKGGKQMIYPLLEINSNKSKNIILKYNMTNLNQSSRYTIGIYVTNFYNTTEAQDNITISTYNVQDFSIDVNSNGSLTVKCVFMQGSINELCYLIFLDAAQGLEKHFTVFGFKEANLTLTESGNYSVEVYDIVGEAITGPAIEAPKLIEVTIISPSTSSEQPTTTVYTTISLSTNIITPTSSNNPPDIPSVTIIIVAVFGAILLLVILILILMLTLCLCYMKRKKGEFTVQPNHDDKVNKDKQKKDNSNENEDNIARCV